MVYYDTVIVGGGLSGLLVARHLHNLGASPAKTWQLLEANQKLGGRLENDVGGHTIDLGGAWIWPHHQPRVSNLVKSLGIESFAQPDDPTSTRIKGGAAEIVRRVADDLPADNIRTNSPVVACRRMHVPQKRGNITCAVTARHSSDHIVSIELESGEKLEARNVVLAAPPKLVSKHIQFDPPLSDEKQTAMDQSQTWMAGVTKVALVYNEARFWPLSVSNGGLQPGPNRPAFQFYDGSPEDNAIPVSSAITFFTLAGLSSAAADDDKTLANHCAEQLASHLSSYGQTYVPDVIVEKLKNFDSFYVKRWPLEKYISEDDDPKGINPHPEPIPSLATNEWDGQLLFAGTECDLRSPGVMEGAVGAALRVFDELKRAWQQQ